MKNITLFFGKIIILICFSIQSTYAAKLSEHLVTWAHKNPIIKVGVDSSFPPFDYVDSQGEPAGVGKIIREQLSKVLPLNLQGTSISNFKLEYDKLLTGEIDTISICGNTSIREEQVLFSDAFLHMTPILVVNKNSGVKNESDINKNHKIASISGYADIEFAQQLSANTIEVKNNIDGYEKVDRGDVDGFITYLYLYKYMINKNNYKNTSPIAISQFKSLSIGFCVNNNKPELVEILNWGIEQLGPDFIIKIQSLWTTDTQITSQENKIQEKYTSSLNNVLIYITAFAALIVILVPLIAKRFANIIAIKLDTSLFRVSFFATLLIIILLLMTAIKVFLNDFKAQVIIDQQETFNITRDVTKKSLNGWYSEREDVIENIAQNYKFRTLINTLVLANKNNNQALLQQTQEQLHLLFVDEPFTTRDGRAYTIANTQGTYLLNFVRSAEGKPSTIKVHKPELFDSILRGHTQFIPPVWANVNIDKNFSINDKDAEIFIVTPVENDQGDIIAVFSIRFDPDEEFSRLFIDGRLGETFESYAIDSNGYMISESRFSQELQQQGVLPIGESTILNIRLPNPETNPIINAAKFKTNGQNLVGYTNYRDNKVVGQWVTFKGFNFTVVSEIDYDEMFAEYQSLSNLLLIGLIISSALIFALSIFMITISKRANEISRRSQEELTKQVEDRTKALENSELRSKLINSSVADGIFGVDKKGKFIFANESATKLVGYSEKEILTHDIISLFGKTNRSIKTFEETDIYKAIQTKTVIRIPHEELVINWGTKLPIEISISPVDNDDSELAAVIAFQDITERLQATERVEKMLENLPVCMVIMSQNDKVEQINQTGVELLGFEKDEIVGMPVDLFIPDEQVISHKALLTKFFADEVVIDTRDLDREFRVKHKSGKLIDIQAVYTPVRFYDGLYAVVMVRDITLDKQAEQALIEAKQLSDDASKAKSDFLANMSHEIRTPMNAIMGMSHLALGCNLERKPKNYVTKVYKAAESLLGIINDILDFSKIEAGKLDLEHIDFNLHDVFDDLANIIGLKTYEKGLELLFDIDKDVPLMLVGDPLRLNQILINIAGNAVKFTEQGEIVVLAKLVSTKEQSENGLLSVQFEVRDSGIGMNNKQKSKLFQSFSQADSSTTRKYGGTGLGLTISKKLVELMAGEIWLESEEGKGSSFFFTTTFRVSNESSVKFIEEQKSFLNEKRILIVDDNAIALDVLKSIMESFHCKVVTANSGKEAIEIANQSTLAFDFFMVDWKMPELDGVETCKIIQEQSNYNSKNFIIVTSNARDDVVMDELKNSIKSVIVKPVTASSVFDEMMRLHGDDALRLSREVKRDDTLIENQKSLAGSKILLVEDNELNQELALELLHQAGIDTDLAENGKQAIEKVADNNYDGVLMDLQMPVMDGLTATGIIRQNYPDLPIIAMTANAMAGDKERVLQAGMNDHITKPINVGDMFATIAKWIKPASPKQAITTSQITATEPEELKLPKFEHINVQAGLAVANGNTKLYIKLLNKFIIGQEKFKTIFEQAWQTQDLEAAIRFAHTLKGSAGNIGAKILQETASKLEHACVEASESKNIESHNDIVKAFTKKTNEQLILVLNELKDYSRQHDTKNISSHDLADYSFDDETLAQLTHLLELIENFETDAIEVAESILEKILGFKQEQFFTKIITQIEGYEFTEAEESLTKFISQANNE